MKSWLIVKALIFALRKFNRGQKLGLHIDEVLDEKFGLKKSEQIQDEIIGIMQKIIKQLKQDRGVR